MRLLSCLRVLLAAFAILASGTLLSAQELEDLLYLKAFDVRFLGNDGNELQIEIVNNNTVAPTETQSRSIINRFIAVPPESEISYTLKDVEWFVYWENGDVEGPFGMEDESTVGPLNAALLRPSGGNSGAFRTISLAQLNYAVTAAVNRGAPNYDRGVAAIKRALIEATISGPRMDEEPSPANLAERDPYLLDFSKYLVVNADMVTTYTRAYQVSDDFEPILDWDAKLQRASEEGTILLSRVTHPGIYKISPRGLSNRGVDPAKLDAARLRIYAGNVQLPVIMSNISAGPFVGDSGIIFYVPDIFPRGSQYIPLWLMQFPNDEEAQAEITTVERVTETATPDTTAVLSTEVYVFEPTQYNKKLPFARNTGQWTSRVVGRGKFEKLPFNVEGLDEGTSASVAIVYAGFANADRHLAQLYINGVKIGGEEIMTGLGPFPRNYEIPPDVLQSGRNVIAVHFPQSNHERTALELAVNEATITYQVDRGNMPQNKLVTLNAPIGDIVRLEVRNRPEETIQNSRYFMDVTDPYKPRLYNTGLNRVGDKVSITADVVGTGEPMKFYYSDPLAVYHFSRFSQVKREELFSPVEGADLIIIAHPSLIPGMREYIEMRRADQLKVAVVSSDGIMNQFNYGAKDYRPIRLFLRYAFANWPGRRPSKVLIVGEASEYPWEDLYPREDVAPNMVPAFGFADGGVSIHCDDSYAQLTDGDWLADVEIGRFSVEQADEARAIARRIWEYETSPPPGPWRSRHLFITDDEPEFARVAERIIGSELNRNAHPTRLYLQDQPYEDYFRIFQRKRSIAMTDAIVNALSEGALTACYLGHGGPNLWSGERIFHYRDIYLLNTEGRRPIMTAASCDTAWIDYPVDPAKQSLAEQFLTHSNGGGIGIFAPVSGTSSYEHDYLLRPFYDALNNKNMRDLGAVTLYSKLYYLLQRGQSYVSNQFILLGDPAMKIPRLTGRIQLQVTPQDFFVNQEPPLTLEGTVSSLQWGVAEFALLDQQGETIAGPQRSAVEAGKFKGQLSLPKFIEPGDYRLVVHAYNTGENKYEMVEKIIPVYEPTVALEWTIDPPIETEISAGQPVTLTLNATNSSPGNMSDIVMSIRNAKSDTTLTSAPLVLPAQRSARWEFKIPAPPGINIIEAVADYQNKQPGQQPVAKRSIEFRAADPALPWVTIPEKLADIRRIASPEGTEFNLPLYNMSGRPLNDVRGNLYLLDRPGGSAVGSEASAAALNPNEKTTLQFMARTRFPEGDLPFRFEFKGVDAESGEEVTQTIDRLFLHITKGDDIVVVPGSVRTERKDYVRGQTVYVRAMIRNDGRQPASNVKTTLYLDYPWDEAAIASSLTGEATETFDRPLVPGESREVRLRWDPAPEASLSVRLYVVANSDRKTVESDYSNNMGDVAVSLLRLPNLAIDKSRLKLSQQYVRPGDVVGVTVPYKNDSPFDFAHYFVTEIRAQGAELADELIYRGTFDKLDSGEEGLIQASWRADGKRDRIYVSVNDDRDYGEQEIADNTVVLDLVYVLNNKFLQDDLYTWSFARTFQYGERTSLYVAPDESLVLTEVPAVRKIIQFSNEYVVGEVLPENERRSDDDNRMAIVLGGLAWSPYEVPTPVRFRIPMPQDDETTLYDIYFTQNAPNSGDGLPVNQYRFLIEDEEEWRTSKPRIIVPEVGRIETRDDYLDITFAPDAVPSWNTIHSVRTAPIQGDFLSAVYEVDRLPDGVFDAEAVTPPGTKVVYDIRVGTGDVYEPNFGDWMRVEPGTALPSGDDVKLFQIRAALLGNEDGLPILKNVFFRLDKSSKVALTAK